MRRHIRSRYVDRLRDRPHLFHSGWSLGHRSRWNYGSLALATGAGFAIGSGAAAGLG